ncbi:hypothetical protein QTG56_22490 (plasmid) [Rossellomorea sp. AcN35-11]|nr:hypothetical protein [Rossellomorea aquimaris]WJV32142.1 hypothetical protein QTG56_22490 [Rossellomorea sp. AcN35-11]
MLAIIDNGLRRVILCPNRVVGLLLKAYTFDEVEGNPSEYEEKVACDCCENDAIYFKDSGTEYRVCGGHAMKLAKKNLSPGDWGILS